MRCFTELLITSVVETTPLQIRRLLSFSLWRTKEGRRSGKHLEPQCGVGFLQRPEKPRMQFGPSTRGSPHFGQLEQLSMNRGICGIWRWLTLNLASLTMLGVALQTR